MSHQYGPGPKSVNKSCNCGICKWCPAKQKKEMHKSYGWRRLRRRSREALRRGDWLYYGMIGTGYKS